MFRKLALAAALAGTAHTGFCADQVIDLSSGSASFSSTGPVLGGGHDTLSFANLAAGTYDFLLSISAQNITGFMATVNGQQATTVTFGKLSFAGLESSGQGPFTLDISGLAGKGAVYSGDFTVTAVREPATQALLMAGLGLVGMLARRRRAAGVA